MKKNCHIVFRYRFSISAYWYALLLVFLLNSCATLDIQYYGEPVLVDNAKGETNCTVSTVSELPQKKTDMCRIVLFSDMHYRTNATERYQRAIDLINKSNADLLLFAGDFMSDENDAAGAISLLRNVTLPCPRLAVRGNWEVYTRHNLLPPDFKFDVFYESAGFTFLREEWRTFKTSAGDINVYAFDSMYADPANAVPLILPDSGIVVLLAHEPARFDRSDVHTDEEDSLSTPPIFMFAGHTHGGQVTFFGHQIFYTKYSGAYMRDASKNGTYQRGRYERDGAVLYVSAGLGQGRYDMRFCSDYDILVTDIPLSMFTQKGGKK